VQIGRWPTEISNERGFAISRHKIQPCGGNVLELRCSYREGKAGMTGLREGGTHWKPVALKRPVFSMEMIKNKSRREGGW
jgi:hypothetical protein